VGTKAVAPSHSAHREKAGGGELIHLISVCIRVVREIGLGLEKKRIIQTPDAKREFAES